MQCPEKTNMTFANAYEKLNCLQLIESTKNNERITLILIFLTITIVIMVAMILYLIRRRRVRTMKPKHVSQPLLPTDQNCVFDIFISYAEADWQIMEEIFRNLSNGSLNQNSFKLAFNEKDCIPGRPTEENLRDLMMQSRKTMVLVSKNYLNSIYFTEELEMALTFQGGSRLLLIALDISALKQFMFTHPLLENFVQVHSYLDFDNGSPRFYKNY